MKADYLRRIHLIVGVAGLLAFVLTGQFMHWELDHLRGMADGPRLFYRTTHIYLMWASALNLALGCFLVQPRDGIRRVGQAVSSMAVLAGPVLLCASFFLETYGPGLERPMSRYANLLAFAGAVGFFATGLLSRKSRPDSQEPV